MRHQHGLDYALLGLIARSDAGQHGYALKGLIETLWGATWQVSLGEIYRGINRLATRRWIEEAEGGPPLHRKTYTATLLGRAKLHAFLAAGVAETLQPFRRELAIKLVLAEDGQEGTLLDVVEALRAAFDQELRRLQAARRKLARHPAYERRANLALDGAELCTQAELVWLDRIAELLTGLQVATASPEDDDSLTDGAMGNGHRSPAASMTP